MIRDAAPAWWNARTAAHRRALPKRRHWERRCPQSAWSPHPFDPRAAMHRAEKFSKRHTIAKGHRVFDTLHVAAALPLVFGKLLTLDG